MKLEKIIEISGVLTLESGLHIGAGDSGMKIGGIDNEVVKDKLSNNPYIPASSLKGKVRHLLEAYYGFADKCEGNPTTMQYIDNIKDEDKNNFKLLVTLFGDKGKNEEESKENKENTLGVTRVSFRDAFISSDWLKENSEIRLTEAKYENVIDRNSGTAKHPRQIERVIRGVEFNFSIALKIMSEDDGVKSISFIKEGLELLQADYLGGSGSRGYGRVRIKELNEKQIFPKSS